MTSLLGNHPRLTAKKNPQESKISQRSEYTKNSTRTHYCDPQRHKQRTRLHRKRKAAALPFFFFFFRLCVEKPEAKMSEWSSRQANGPTCGHQSLDPVTRTPQICLSASADSGMVAHISAPLSAPSCTAQINTDRALAQAQSGCASILIISLLFLPAF